MRETKFPAQMLRSYNIEIFGSGEHKSPLILKNLPQRTKFHLRKLGEDLFKHEKDIMLQAKAVRDEYVVKIKNEDGTETSTVPDERAEEFKKKIAEIEGIEIPLLHYDFTEADFIDKATNDVVAGEMYFNIIDKLIYENQENQ